MMDIVRPIPIEKPVEIEKKIEREMEKVEKKVEEFEKEEEKRFRKDEEIKIKTKKRLSLRGYLLVTAALVLLGLATYSAIEFLPKAKIKIVTIKEEWSYINSIIAAKDATEGNLSQKQIPAEIFSLKKNFTFSFPATGKKQVERKASGKIIIYNAYSSDLQTLVANTRFLTPDNKIFRLNEKTVVPGAKIIEGKIVPSNIEVVVTSDRPGPEYNIGPVSRFTIPGFQGSEKYQKFYAESKEPMKGGFIGEQAFPTDEDVKKGKEKAEKELKDYIDSFLSLQISPEFKVIDGSKQFIILKEEVNKEVDEKGNFTIFAEAKSSMIVFRESDLKNLMEQAGRADLGADFKIKEYKLEYGVGRADFKQGRISFAIDFKGVFEQPFNPESFKQEAVKRNEKELKNLISSFPNIEKVVVSFWPFWVKKVPDNPQRVKIEVE